MSNEITIFILSALALLGIIHLVLYLFFRKLAGMIYKPVSLNGEKSMKKFSNSLKWGLFLALFPIIEPLISPDEMDLLGTKKFFIVIAVINFSWIIIELSKIEKFKYYRLLI
ncbi:MAG: hypothetical protein WDZ72_13435 [Cyclobacteriaceae bacterium]